VNLAVHFIKEQSNTEMFLRVVPFYIILLIGVGGMKRIVGRRKGGRWGKLVFYNRKNGSPYFIYVVAIISI